MADASPDWWNECAREIGKLSDKWTWFKLERLGAHEHSQGTLVTGAECSVVFTRGPRKGYPKWAARDKKTERVVFVSNEAYEARRERYEAETGKCKRCCGEGRVSWGWSKEEGAKYRPCPRCKATGQAPAKAEAA